jgi:hypothetical protein
VVKPIELLQIYSDRQAQALQDMLEELALIEAEAQSREKGKEKLDPSDRGHHAVGDGSDDEDDEGDADMQEVVKELVMDLEALNSGKAVQLEPEFDAPASDFFVAAGTTSIAFRSFFVLLLTAHATHTAHTRTRHDRPHATQFWTRGEAGVLRGGEQHGRRRRF